MSEDVYYKGTLTPVDAAGDTLEEKCKNVLSANGVELSIWNDSWEEPLKWDSDDHYVVIGEDIYSVDCEDVDPYDSIFNASKNEDGTINFEVKYYNGGCGLSKAIETAVDRMKGK
jgi:hypothetical protein